MGDNVLSHSAYQRVSSGTSSGNRTAKAKERHAQGKGLDPLVDPAGYGVIRRSLSRMNPKDLFFELTMGIAMLVEKRLDTTGSMGDNVDIAFDALPRTYELLRKVLSRYDLQIITSIFADAVDDYMLCRSQAEMGEKIAEQMTMMVPESGGGGNGGEDPQFGLFGAAYLTAADINRYGLKSYDFTVTDEPSHEYVGVDALERVFGKEVLKKVEENGFKMSPKKLPSVKEIIDALLLRAHAFVFIIGDRTDTRRYWPTVIASERLIFLPNTKLLPEVEVAIIGLTEGVLTLDTLEDFLIDEAKCSKQDAKLIKRAVAGIPIGAQMEAENFNKIPLAGTLFKEKRDLWPIEDADVVITESKPKKGNGKGKMWA